MAILHIPAYKRTRLNTFGEERWPSFCCGLVQSPSKESHRGYCDETVSLCSWKSVSLYLKGQQAFVPDSAVCSSMTPASVRMPSYEKFNNMMSVFTCGHLVIVKRGAGWFFSCLSGYSISCWTHVMDQTRRCCEQKAPTSDGITRLNRSSQYVWEGLLSPRLQEVMGEINSVSSSSFSSDTDPSCALDF